MIHRYIFPNPMKNHILLVTLVLIFISFDDDLALSIHVWNLAKRQVHRLEILLLWKHCIT